MYVEICFSLCYKMNGFMRTHTHTQKCNLTSSIKRTLTTITSIISSKNKPLPDALPAEAKAAAEADPI